MSAQGPIDEAFQRAISRGIRDDRFDLPDRRGRPGRLAPDSASRITRRITAIALTLGILMAAGKLWLVGQTSSVGVLASLVHSGLDIFAAASSFISVRIAAMMPTKRYRFGFGKVESVSAVFQVCLIIFAAFHLFGAAFGQVASHAGHNHGVGPDMANAPLAMVTMGVFVALTLWLIIGQSWAIRATGSIAVRGDRAHYFADLLGNLMVIAGLGFAAFTDWHWADAAVGVVMALWLLYTAWRVGKLAWAQLMDQELLPDERKLITNLVMSDERVRAVTELRTRAAGPNLHMQMRLDLDPALSLSDAHDIVLQAEARITSAFPAADVLIHPHPAGCAHGHGNPRFRV